MRKRRSGNHFLSEPYSRENYILYHRLARRHKKRLAVEYKGGSCEHCKGTFQDYVYDFHHLDPSTKEARGSLFLSWTWERSKIELDKCVLLCANCHRIVHYKEKENKMNDELNTDKLLDIGTEEATLVPAADAAGITLDAPTSEAIEALFYQDDPEADAELVETAPF